MRKRSSRVHQVQTDTLDLYPFLMIFLREKMKIILISIIFFSLSQFNTKIDKN